MVKGEYEKFGRFDQVSILSLSLSRIDLEPVKTLPPIVEKRLSPRISCTKMVVISSCSRNRPILAGRLVIEVFFSHDFGPKGFPFLN